VFDRSGTPRASAQAPGSSTPTSPRGGIRARRSACADDRFVAFACDGRSRRDAGLTLTELAALMCALGCDAALNLDGGGSTSLVIGGRCATARGGFESPEPGGRPISTALLFVPR
jgi:hypothetical protein